MTVMPWILLIIGLGVVGVGCFVGWRSGGRMLVLLGATNVVVAATILVENYANNLRVPALVTCAIFLLGVAVTTSRDTWHAARVEAILGGATILGMWFLYFMTPEVSSTLRTTVLVVVGALAAAFVGVSLAKAFRRIQELRR